MARTIQSPGVEIKEIDRSIRPVLPAGTNVLVAGYADKGPTDEVVQVTSVSDYNSLYGQAQTPAERYFSSTIRPLLDTPANVFTYRLPYGPGTGIGFGTKYSALAYPASGYNFGASFVENTGLLPTKYSQIGVGTAATTTSARDTDGAGGVVILGAPSFFELTESQYNAILNKGDFDASTKAKGSFRYRQEDLMTASFSGLGDLGKAAMIVLNKGQSVINQRFEGYYVGLTDNNNLNPATDFDALRSVKSLSLSSFRYNIGGAAVGGKTFTSYTAVNTNRIDGSLTAVTDNSTITFGQDSDSASEQLENLPTFDVTGSNYDDTVALGVFRLRQSPFTPDVIKLAFNLEEGYVGSFDFHRQINSPDGGAPQSFYLAAKEDQSRNIKVITNDFLSRKNETSYLDNQGNPKVKIRVAGDNIGGDIDNNWSFLSGGFAGQATAINIVEKALVKSLAESVKEGDHLFPLGNYQSQDLDSKVIGNTPQKLDRLFDTVDNVELFDVDITVDGGLSTIYSTTKYVDSEGFDDTVAFSGVDGFRTTKTSSDSTAGDPGAREFRGYWNDVTNRFINFAEFRRKDHMFISDLPRSIFVQGEDFLTLQDPNKNFSRDILNPIKAFRTVNSNYVASYAQWIRTYDEYADSQVYVPFSGYAAAAMANTDSNFQPWFAPAGFTRGRVIGASDLALFPTQKQRDMLYKNNVNPVAFFPGEGFVIFGQKTLQKLPSAFDRVNVRRLFLNLEKAVRNTVRFFIFEPNTLLTRTRVVNTITPIFENAKNTEGLFDYLIVCDERNNTPDVIDNNELKVDIYLKPTRSAEFILVNFFATKTGTDFTELVG